MGESPDRNWLALGTRRCRDFPGRWRRSASDAIQGLATTLRWSGDGKHLFVQVGFANLDKAYVLPLSPGRPCPRASSMGFRPSRRFEVARSAGHSLRNVVVPGPTADIYAFTRESVQRNLYRIPVP